MTPAVARAHITAADHDELCALLPGWTHAETRTRKRRQEHVDIWTRGNCRLNIEGDTEAVYGTTWLASLYIAEVHEAGSIGETPAEAVRVLMTRIHAMAAAFTTENT